MASVNRIIPQIDLDPLSIDLILFKVLNNLPVYYLTNARLVSQHWNYFGTKILKERLLKGQGPNIILQLEVEKIERVSQHDFLQHYQTIDIPLLKKFMTQKDSIPFHFTKFIFKNILMQKEIVMNFFSHNGCNITHLKLYSRTANGRFDLMSLSTFHSILSCCPNLKYLVLNQLPIGRDVINPFKGNVSKTLIKYLTLSMFHEEEELEDFLQCFLSCCPSLQGLKIHAAFPINESIPLILSTKYYINLRELKLREFHSELLETIQSLRLRNLEFETVTLHGKEGEEGLFTILKSQTHTLQSFAVLHSVESRVKNGCKPQINFPEMKELRHLHLAGSVNFSCSNFVAQFPRLRHFILKGYSKTTTNLFSSPCSTPHEGVSGLVLPSLKDLEIINAINMFPNVKHLEVTEICKNSLGLIFSNWLQLESLCIRMNNGGGLHYCTEHSFEQHRDLTLDSALTGLTSTECALLACQKDLREFKPQSQFQQSTSLINLKELRALSILGGHNLNKSGSSVIVTWKLTDASIWVISQLKHLNSLRMDEHDITEQGIATLCNSIKGLQYNRKESRVLDCKKDFSNDYQPHPFSNQNRQLWK